ncbi:hypothetical protein EW146_g5148 [Bondarzewia mesenterica]|uniref:Cytochrome P450 n=1 Tax=Bondarzewia mesenterica TaxID=1095465 RepID=A0A4S4LSZ9_9AGAM|nr:hypothetical protein EW146_g5148 [Bondarzewia mesenterica]
MFLYDDVPSSILLKLLWLVPVLWVAYMVMERSSATRKLAGIPTVGHTGLLGSCWDAINPLAHNEKIVMDGYKKYRGGLFKISRLNVWNVVVASPELLHDLRRAPENEMSLFFGFAEAFTSEMAQGLDPTDHKLADFHVPAILHGITRNADAKFPELLDEIEVFFDEICPADGPNGEFNARYFVGLPLCRNPEYLALAKKFTIGAVASGLVCLYLPPFLRPIIRSLFSPMTYVTRKVMKYTAPIIEERMRMERELGAAWKDETPNDLFTWLLAEAPPQQRTPFHIAQRVLFTNMASSTSLSSSITYGIYHLAANMQFIEPLREEAEHVIGQFGWSKASLDSMKLMESFVRENLRYHGAGVLTMNRMIVKPGGFTFSNGVTVPEGTLVSVPEQAFHYDPAFHEDPDELNPYRFLDKENPDAMSSRISTPDESYLIFGLGRHSCPGRFYGAVLLKLIFTFILLNFDFKLENDDGKKPPRHVILGSFFMPNTKAKIMFRRRKEAEKLS